MARYDLSETEWRLNSPLLPNKPRGVARVDDRRVINGIFYVLRGAVRDQPGDLVLVQAAACDDLQVREARVAELPRQHGDAIETPLPVIRRRLRKNP